MDDWDDWDRQEENDADIWEVAFQYVIVAAKVLGIVLAVAVIVAWFAYSLWRELAIYSWLVGMG